MLITGPNLFNQNDTSLLPSETNIIVHQHEKDSAGTTYVIENKERLTKESEKVFELLKKRLRLNNKQCITDGITGSLSSRVSEINKYLEQFGIVVSKEWKYINEVKSYKEYFLTEDAINKLR